MAYLEKSHQVDQKGMLEERDLAQRREQGLGSGKTSIQSSNTARRTGGWDIIGAVLRLGLLSSSEEKSVSI